MRWLGILMTLLVCAGCRSSRVQPQPLPMPAAQQPVVWVRGDVKHFAVPWNEELTLARAIVAAEYTGLWDPRLITIFRQGEAYKVRPRDLLAGRDDPPLEPGDTIVIDR